MVRHLHSLSAAHIVSLLRRRDNFLRRGHLSSSRPPQSGRSLPELMRERKLSVDALCYITSTKTQYQPSPRVSDVCSTGWQPAAESVHLVHQVCTRVHNCSVCIYRFIRVSNSQKNRLRGRGDQNDHQTCFQPPGATFPNDYPLLLEYCRFV